MTSRAKELFVEIRDGGPAYVRSFVDRRTAETHFLEFKGGRIQTDKKGAKEAWSEALSGFANTEGGVLVFGIRASRTPDPENPSLSIDTAHEVDLVEQPAVFRQWLRDRLLEAAEPPISGVELLDLVDPVDSDRGYVVCYIPEGSDKPYRASLHTTKNYMQRVDDRFVVLQHSLLRTMFYPRLRSEMLVEIEPNIERVESDVDVTFKGSITNLGAATARELWVVVRADRRMRREAMFSFKPREGMVEDGQAWEAFQSIHPGATVPVFWYELKLKAEASIPNVKFSIQLHAQHQLAQEVEIDLTADDIKHGRRVAGRTTVCGI